MAGTTYIFDQTLVDWARGVHRMGSIAAGTGHTYKQAYVDNATTMTVTLSNPTWGAAGGINLSLNEQSGGNYTAGGTALTNVTVTLSSGQAKIDYDDPAQVATNASNPQSIYYSVVYNDSYSSKPVVSYQVLDGPINGVTTALQVTPNATNGLALGNQA
jgi:hypothetical protein